MPILFPSITLGYSGVVSFYQLYLFLLSHHNFHLLVIIFGLTIYDRLCYLFSFARPWCFFAVSLYSCIYFLQLVSSCTFMFHSKVFCVSFHSTWPWADGFWVHYVQILFCEFDKDSPCFCFGIHPHCLNVAF